MKKQGLGTVFLFLAVICGVAGMILYYINATAKYYDDFQITVIMWEIAGILVVIVNAFCERKWEYMKWTSLLYPLAGVLFAVTAVMFIGERVESAAIILGSNLESGNTLAKILLYQAFAGIGCFLAGMLLVGVAAFFNQERAAVKE